ncbi:MAG TPA: MdtA/MuxA family multidrug efflux RND transporter periplasmic adaptor subunit [Acetobacteraceae bacterium]|nr:MdtA/MuxA family multidrug efflux RND transporter periplasmic adaptor subunit [Acetobacteraceae bacterium]
MDERTDPAVARGYGAPPARRETVEAPKVRGRRRVLPFVLVLALIAGAILWAHPWAGRPRKGPPSVPPQPVSVATATTGDMPVILNALGTVTPFNTVTVMTQINGQLMSVGFKEGQIVQKGQFLAQIDPRPFQVALEQAEGQLAHDTGLLDQARSDLARFERLKAQNSIAEQQVSDQQFLVQQLLGTVKSDQGAIASDKLNLTYCHITAPLTGRVGLLQIDPGNYVQTSNTTGIVVITELDPISVIFTLPQNDIEAVTEATQSDPALPVTLYDSTNTRKLATGTLYAMDNQINVTTGTVQLRASFANPKYALFPNEFVNVDLLVKTLKNAVLVPGAAIQRGAPGTFVYVVQPDGTVAVQKVKLGPSNADETAITSGLTAGAKVVTDGADRLHPGAKVTIVPPATAAAASTAAKASAAKAAGVPPAAAPASGAPAATGTQAAPSSSAPSSAAPPSTVHQRRSGQGDGRSRTQGAPRGESGRAAPANQTQP